MGEEDGGPSSCTSGLFLTPRSGLLAFLTSSSLLEEQEEEEDTSVSLVYEFWLGEGVESASLSEVQGGEGAAPSWGGGVVTCEGGRVLRHLHEGYVHLYDLLPALHVLHVKPLLAAQLLQSCVHVNLYKKS